MVLFLSATAPVRVTPPLRGYFFYYLFVIVGDEDGVKQEPGVK